MDHGSAARDLNAIAERLRALSLDRPSPTLGPELQHIRADLRLHALDNAEVGRRLAARLGIPVPPDPAR